MSPVAINGVDKQGVDVNGVQVKQALSNANSTVNKGVYDATLLETVDPDLAVGNIKDTINIFGKVGTLPAGGIETIEKYADAEIANLATYTPAASGIFFNPRGTASAGGFSIDYYSTGLAAWCRVRVSANTLRGATAIGDGTNFRIKNNSGVDYEYCLMRQYYSTATYERAWDESLAAGVSRTPANSGFFAQAADLGSIGDDVRIETQMTTLGWSEAFEASAFAQPVTLAIGDGINLRVRNSTGGAYQHVTMRAKLT